MLRKDCKPSLNVLGWERRLRYERLSRGAALLALSLLLPTSELFGGSVRVWPSAVVVDETILLSDLAEFHGFDSTSERSLAAIKVTGAPPPGGSRVVHMAMIRAALRANGTNMAVVTLHGSTKCDVTRPSIIAPEPPPSTRPKDSQATGGRAQARDHAATSPGSSAAGTLRQAVQDYFDRQLARYRGLAELAFNRTSQQVLDLSGPAYDFAVRRRHGPSLGLIQIEVVVTAQGRTVQKVPLVVQVSMVRRVVMARRPINQAATVRARDVELVPMTFTRLDKLGIGETAQAIGQRAKRFIPSGSVIQPTLLESVPLVTRGQLVTLTSVAGAVRIVTTGKALQNGLFGESIRVGSLERKRVEFEAVVVGPGSVQIGGRPRARREMVVSMRDDG